MALVLTQNAKFDPFTFQDLAAPYLLVDKAAGEVEEALDSTLSKSNLMRKYAEEEPNAEYSKAYKAYADNLEHQAEQFSKYGLSAGLRDSIRMARNNYGKVVTPIELAAAKREKIYEKRDPNAIYKNRTLSLSDIINETYDNSSITEKDIANNMAVSYNPVFRTAYSKAIQSGMNVDQAILKAQQESTGVLLDEMNRIKSMGYNIQDPKIQRAFNLGINATTSDILKEEMMTWKDIQDMKDKQAARALAWAKHREDIANNEFNRRYKLAQLAAQGYTIDRDGNIVKLNSDDPNPNPNLRTIPGIGEIKELYDMNKNLILDNGALSADYFGNKNKRSSNNIPTFVNPMKIYEEIQKIKNKYGNSEPRVSASTGDVIYPKNYYKVAEEIEQLYKQYGVTKVLTDSEYAQLKDLGYSSTSTYSDFRNNLQRQLNESIEYDRSTSINSSSIPKQDKIKATINRWNDQGNLNIKLYDFYNPTKHLNYEDISTKTSTGEKVNDIVDVQYSTTYPNKVIVIFDNGKVALASPELLGGEMEDLINYYEKVVKDIQAVEGTSRRSGGTYNKTDIGKELNNIEKIVAAQIRGNLNSEVPTQSKTTTKLDTVI